MLHRPQDGAKELTCVAVRGCSLQLEDNHIGL